VSDKTDNHHDDGEVRALRQLVHELREAPPPELDWTGIEERLVTRIAKEHAPRRRRAPGFGTVAVFAVAAAAAVMLLMGQASLRTAIPQAAAPRAVDLTELATAPVEADELPLYRVATMTSNALVQSGDFPLRFTLEGVATWTLQPHSRAVVRTTAEPHVVSLEEGTLVAEVVPRSDTDALVESFAVEAGTTRVAVHGTIFSVERSGDRITVEVMRGSVAVGPTGHRGATVGHLLVSPTRASFSTVGGRLLEVLQPTPTEPPSIAANEPSDTPQPIAAAHESPAPVDDVTHPTEAPHPIALGGVNTPAPANEPANIEPAPAPVPRPLDVNEARALVVACITGAMGKAQSDKVLTVSSDVTARSGADGTVQTVRFSPPLRADLQQRCAGALFGRSLAAGGASISFRVTFAQR
jgi:FecR-like protein